MQCRQGFSAQRSPDARYRLQAGHCTPLTRAMDTPHLASALRHFAAAPRQQSPHSHAEHSTTRGPLYLHPSQWAMRLHGHKRGCIPHNETRRTKPTTPTETPLVGSRKLTAFAEKRARATNLGPIANNSEAEAPTAGLDGPARHRKHVFLPQPPIPSPILASGFSPR